MTLFMKYREENESSQIIGYMKAAREFNTPDEVIKKTDI